MVKEDLNAEQQRFPLHRRVGNATAPLSSWSTDSRLTDAFY